MSASKDTKRGTWKVYIRYKDWQGVGQVHTKRGLLEGKLNEYMHDIDEECHEMLDRIVEKMKEKQDVTEQLKAENQMLWVVRMNNIIACVEEIVVREVAYV